VKVSVVIPTLDEEECLESALTRLRLTALQGDIEILVCDAGSADGTLAVAGRLADKVVRSPRRGRAVQMHQGALAAKGELLLFLHADTRLPKNWLDALMKSWTSKPLPGATAFRLGFDSARPIYRLIAALGDWRSRKTRVPHGDQGVACRRQDYMKVGGFPAVPLMEEYYLLPKLARLGPVVILDEAVMTSTRRYERNGPLFNGLRNAAIIALFKAGVPAERLARLYQ
jgi:rSAM/selenodomain-associated transferase 2